MAWRCGADGSGVTGYYFSGVMVFSPYGGPNYGTVTGYDNSATAAEGDSFDMCSCHAASTSQPSYHCHVPPSCLLGQLGQESSSHSPQIGWAADGFPIYGPRGPGGVMMKRCAVTGGTEGVDDCTDAGGGLHRELPDVDDYVYRYYTLGIYNDGEQCANPVADLPGEEYCASWPADAPHRLRRPHTCAAQTRTHPSATAAAAPLVRSAPPAT